MPGRALLATLTGFALSGCISLQVGSKDPKEPDYKFEEPNAGWSRVHFDDAGAAATYRSTDSGSVLGLGSSCDGGAASSFDPLLNTVTSSVPRRKVVEPVTQLDGAPLPGRFTRVNGSVDGERIEMLAIVLKSDECVYDVTLTGRTVTETDRAEAIRLARSLREISL